MAYKLVAWAFAALVSNGIGGLAVVACGDLIFHNQLMITIGTVMMTVAVIAAGIVCLYAAFRFAFSA